MVMERELEISLASKQFKALRRCHANGGSIPLVYQGLCSWPFKDNSNIKHFWPEILFIQSNEQIPKQNEKPQDWGHGEQRVTEK